MSQEKNPSLSIAIPHEKGTDVLQLIGIALASIGTLIVFIAWGMAFSAQSLPNNGLMLTLALGGIFVGTALFAYRKYMLVPAGIKNNRVFQASLTGRGALGWAAGIILTGFYVLIYWYPSYLGYQNGVDGANTGMIALFDPLARFFKGPDAKASQWFVYGTLYTIIIISLGVKFLMKYRHNRYQLIRTSIVIASQLFFAYLIPEILAGLNYNDAVDASGQYIGWYDTDLKNMWPLDYDFFQSWHMDAMAAQPYQPLGKIFLVWGIIMFLVVTPIITYFVGKRWYCSMICGCGGLAETAGDPWRQLSSKKMHAWKIERWLIHGVMVFIFIVTAATMYGYFSGQGQVFGLEIYTYFEKPYGFFIGAIFSGIIGVGFYPLMGTRVWCRFGCPMAGYMGLIQRFKSRFRITTNGGQCISCGNCSTYCEQGIDVRWYAQRGENIVRASCVGCGVCSAVCPRGVLKLENGPEEDRISDSPIIIGNEGIKLAENEIK